MHAMQGVHVERGFPPTHRRVAALLYNEAFGEKLSAAMPDAKSRIALIESTLDPDYSFVAVAGHRLLGLAGIHTTDGSLTGGLDRMGFRVLVRSLGLPQAVRAAFIMSLFEREPGDGELLLDGMAVARPARGSGMGSMLLRAVRSFAVAEGFRTIRLDVVDTNPRARALYERHGFVATETRLFPVLGNMLGFGASTTMTLQLPERD